MVAVGTVMAVLDSSIANTALPTIARELHATAAQSIWVVNGFQLAVTMTILIYASLGEGDSAMEWLEKAYEERTARLLEVFDPAFDSLRSDARFQDLVRRMGLVR